MAQSFFMFALFATIFPFHTALGAEPLFVFGDSFADTGNHNISQPPWVRPYGITWPGHPSGRFSNGQLLTDFVAKAMTSEPPIPYRVYSTSKSHALMHKAIKHGLNFAVGGSGVFQAFNPTNLSVQVGQLASVVHTLNSHQLYHLERAPVLIAIDGNDYLYFLMTNGTITEFPAYIEKVVAEVARNVVRLYGLGLRKFVLPNLMPTGCLPSQTATVSYKHCITAFTPLVQLHNELLAKTLNATLTGLEGAKFVILDQFKAFQSVFAAPGRFGIKHKLQPCCAPKPGFANSCGDVDARGKPLYVLCSNPETHLFWDGFHPTQAGWTAFTSYSFVLSLGQHGYINLASWLQN